MQFDQKFAIVRTADGNLDAPGIARLLAEPDSVPGTLSSGDIILISKTTEASVVRLCFRRGRRARLFGDPRAQSLHLTKLRSSVVSRAARSSALNSRSPAGISFACWRARRYDRDPQRRASEIGQDKGVAKTRRNQSPATREATEANGPPRLQSGTRLPSSPQRTQPALSPPGQLKLWQVRNQVAAAKKKTTAVRSVASSNSAAAAATSSGPFRI
jgi:hypothetical protein